MPEQRGERREQRGICLGVKVGEDLLVRVRPAVRVRAEGEIDDRRVAWKGRAAAQGFFMRQLV